MSSEHPTDPAPHPDTPEWAIPLVRQIREMRVLLEASIDDQAELHELGRKHEHRLRELELWRETHSNGGAL